MTLAINENSNLSQKERVWLIRDLVEPIIGEFKRLYKDPRDNGHRLSYCGINILSEQIAQVESVISGYQSRVRFRSNKKYDQILEIRVYEVVE